MYKGKACSQGNCIKKYYNGSAGFGRRRIDLAEIKIPVGRIRSRCMYNSRIRVESGPVTGKAQKQLYRDMLAGLVSFAVMMAGKKLG